MVKTLANAFKSGRIAQSYMLSGTRGIGKTTTARIIARSLNYKTADVDIPTVEFEGFGEHCQSIIQGNHVDVVELDAASHTSIDDVREIIEQMYYKPISARFKVYIMDEVQMLSTAAFNGLLKTLEEPPPHVKFIFATTEIRKVPITVLSRCQRFDLHRISIGNLIGLFTKILHQESIESDPESIAMIARASDGSVRDGLSLLDQAIARCGDKIEASTVRLMLALADRNRIMDLFGYLIKGDIVKALQEFSLQYDSGANPSVVLYGLADFTHLVTRIKYVPEMADTLLYSEAENLRASGYAKEVSVTVLSRFWQMILKGLSEIEGFSRPMEAVEMILIRLAHSVQLPSPEEIAHYIVEEKQKKKNDFLSSPALLTRVAKIQKDIPSDKSFPSGDNEVVEKPNMLSVELSSRASDDYIERLTELCENNHDDNLKEMLRKFLRVFYFEIGILEVACSKDAPEGFIENLVNNLKNWTGKNWEIRFALGQCYDNFRIGADIQAVRAIFPNAQVVSIRTFSNS